MTVDPKSVAGVLLREHDTPQQALKYADRKAGLLAAMGSGLACDYIGAAAQLRKMIAEAEYGEPWAILGA